MRVAIIDDHVLVRSGLADVVERALGATVVHQGEDPSVILDLTPIPDVLLLEPRRPSLSPVQERVLTLYASGMKLDSVARAMGISPGTAATHLKRARAKYSLAGRDTSSRVDLYRAALRDGLIDE